MKTNRRDFLKAVGGIGLFSIVPSSVLGGRGRVAPSDQLTKGIIGVGGIGRSSYHFTSDKYCRLVAMCDVDSKHLEQAKAEAKRLGYSFIQVKTVQMGRYAIYDDTNRFYLSLGFKELEVFPTLWDEWNPCQIYIMTI